MGDDNQEAQDVQIPSPDKIKKGDIAPFEVIDKEERSKRMQKLEMERRQKIFSLAFRKTS